MSNVIEYGGKHKKAIAIAVIFVGMIFVANYYGLFSKLGSMAQPTQYTGDYPFQVRYYDTLNGNGIYYSTPIYDSNKVVIETKASSASTGIMLTSLSYHSGNSYWIVIKNTSYPYTSAYVTMPYKEYYGQDLTYWDGVNIGGVLTKSLILTKVNTNPRLNLLKFDYANNTYVLDASKYDFSDNNYKFVGFMQVKITTDHTQVGASWYNPANDIYPNHKTWIVMTMNTTIDTFSVDGWSKDVNSKIYWYCELTAFTRDDSNFKNGIFNIPITMNMYSATKALKITFAILSDNDASEMNQGIQTTASSQWNIAGTTQFVCQI